MRNFAFAPAFLIIGSFALAGGGPLINLDQPGVLTSLNRSIRNATKPLALYFVPPSTLRARAAKSNCSKLDLTSGISSAACY